MSNTGLPQCSHTARVVGNLHTQELRQWQVAANIQAAPVEHNHTVAAEAEQHTAVAAAVGTCVHSLG
jgi:hypothetical protein